MIYKLPEIVEPDDDSFVTVVVLGLALSFTEYKNGIFIFNPNLRSVRV